MWADLFMDISSSLAIQSRNSLKSSSCTSESLLFESRWSRFADRNALAISDCKSIASVFSMKFLDKYLIKFFDQSLIEFFDQISSITSHSPILGSTSPFRFFGESPSCNYSVKSYQISDKWSWQVQQYSQRAEAAAKPQYHSPNTIAQAICFVKLGICASKWHNAMLQWDSSLRSVSRHDHIRVQSTRRKDSRHPSNRHTLVRCWGSRFR